MTLNFTSGSAVCKCLQSGGGERRCPFRFKTTRSWPPSDEPLHHIRPFFEGRSSHFREGDSSSHEQLLASDGLVDT